MRGNRSRTPLLLPLTAACATSIVSVGVARSSSWVSAHGRRLRPTLTSARGAGDPFDATFWQELSEKAAFDRLGDADSEFSDIRPFNHQRWRRHASSARYVNDIRGLLFGTTSARIAPIMGLLVIFSSMVEVYSYFSARRPSLPELRFPAEPFEFTAPLLGLLLVFRTNSSYLRYTAACKAVQEITGDLSSLVRQLLTWSDGETEKADVDRIIDLVVAYHCWLFTAYLVSQEDQEGKEALATLNARLGRTGEAPLSPAQIHVLLSWEISQLPHLTVFQRKDMDQCLLVGVTRGLATCEQLLRTPIPVNYTRSLLRFLWLWLTLLPFSLVKSFTDFWKGTWWEGQPLYVVPLAVAFIAFFFLSLEDIAVQIEEPFVVQRKQLRRLSERFRQDADDMRDVIRHCEASKIRQ